MKHGLTVILLAVSLSSFGQMAEPALISSAGDNYTSSGKQISWSLGEVIIETFSNGNISLTQGFHQGSYLVTAMDDPVLANMVIKAFPNPATDFISVQIAGSRLPTDKYIIRLTDIHGIHLLILNVNTHSPQVNLQNYPAGTYFLSVSTKGKVLRTFKIIKAE